MRSVEQLVGTVRIGTIFETEYVGINNWDLETYRKRKVKLTNFDNPIEQCGMHYKSGQFQGLHFVTGNPHIIIPYHARLPKLNESRPQNSDKQTVSMEKK